MLIPMGASHPSHPLISKDVRNHNIGLLLTQLSRHPGVSRSFLTKATGLAPGSVTALINELEGYGLVTPVNYAQSPKREPGRRKELLALADDSYAIAAIELKNESVRIQCTTLSGKPLVDEEYAKNFHGSSPSSFADFAAQQILHLTAFVRQHGLKGLPIVGIVVPAPVYDDHNTLLAAIDFGWGRTRLGDIIIDHLTRQSPNTNNPTIIIFNDANSALWAEYVRICDQNPQHPPKTVVYIKSDIGIGGSAIIQGRTFNGSRGTAIEPGHIQIDPLGRRCACGRRGCLVTTADPSIVLEHAGLTSADKEQGRDAALAMLLRKEYEGDTLSHQALAEADKAIKQVLGNILILLTPNCAILGGYLSDRVDEIANLDETILQALGYSDHQGKDAILPSHYGQSASTVGTLMKLRDFILYNAVAIATGLPWSWREE